MSYIVRAGNLAGPPRTDRTDDGPRTTVTVIVNDTAYRDGQWVTTATTPYRLYIRGHAGLNLTRLQATSGNVAVIFAGALRSREYTDQTGQPRVSNDVYVDHIGPDLTRGTYATLDADAHASAGAAGTPDDAGTSDATMLDAPWPTTATPGSASWH